MEFWSFGRAESVTLTCMAIYRGQISSKSAFQRNTIPFHYEALFFLLCDFPTCLYRFISLLVNLYAIIFAFFAFFTKTTVVFTPNFPDPQRQSTITMPITKRMVAYAKTILSSALASCQRTMKSCLVIG